MFEVEVPCLPGLCGAFGSLGADAEASGSPDGDGSDAGVCGVVVVIGVPADGVEAISVEVSEDGVGVEACESFDLVTDGCEAGWHGSFGVLDAGVVVGVAVHGGESG